MCWCVPPRNQSSSLYMYKTLGFVKERKKKEINLKHEFLIRTRGGKQAKMLQVQPTCFCGNNHDDGSSTIVKVRNIPCPTGRMINYLLCLYR